MTVFTNLLDYTIETVPEIMNVPIIFEIGKSNNFKEIQGVVVGYGEVSKSSTIPIFIKVENSKGEINSYNLFYIKNFRRID
tara:strand:- start:674 stop:916 length:243 start_codon:yes stop_codon:yes gene_type:complete